MGKKEISLKKLLFEKGVNQADQASDAQLAQQLADDFAVLKGKYETRGKELKEIKKELRGLKNSAQGLFKQGVICLKKGELFDSAGYFNAVLALEPENLKALNNLAVIYNEMEMFEKARAILEKILAIEPDNEIAGRNLELL